MFDNLRLAEEVDFFDLIIGGHSHTALSEPQVVNGTPIAQAGSNARNVGVLDLTIDGETGDVSVQGRLQSVAEVEKKDPIVEEMVKQYNADTEELLSEVLGVTNTGLSRDDRWSKDVALGNMITDALRTFANTEIAITNNGGIRASIAPGDITARDIFTVDPFGNSINILEMTGYELKEVIAYSYHRSLANYGPQIDLQTSGMTYIIYTDEEGLYADSELFVDGQPMDMDQTFRIATNNFIVAGGDGYDFSKAEIITGDAGQVTNALIQYVQDVTASQGAVDYEPTEGRIQVMDYVEEDPVVPDEEDEDETDEDENENGEIVDEEGNDNGEEPNSEDPNGDDGEGTTVPGTDTPEGDDKETEVEDDDKEESDTEKEEEVTLESERLPQTATLTWTIGLVGLSSVGAGAAAHFIKKKR